MMPAGRRGTIARERPLQQGDAGDPLHLKPAPARNSSRTLSIGLPGQQADHAVLHAIIVRLGNALFVVKHETYLPLLLNSSKNYFVSLRIDACHQLIS